MTTHTAELSAEVSCDRCGYDVRAQPEDGICPECGASVAHSRRVAAIPRRPAWRDSDPRWRRRILGGVWVLVFLPLMIALETLGWDSKLTVPTIFDYRGDVTLHEMLVAWPGVYDRILFCIGVVLLFSKERGRRRNPLDWARRWGVMCSYVVSLLGAAPILFLCALVLTGIAAAFMSIPLKYQPEVTKLFAEVGFAYLHYGPCPRPRTDIVLAVFSSITILLACKPLYEALYSSGAKHFAAIPLVMLGFFALMNLARAFESGFSVPRANQAEMFYCAVYFAPALVAGAYAGRVLVSVAIIGDVVVEIAKWCIVVAIAMQLSIAQLAARRGALPAKKRQCGPSLRDF